MLLKFFFVLGGCFEGFFIFLGIILRSFFIFGFGKALSIYMVVWSVPPFAFMTYLISFQRIKSCHRGRIHDCSCLGGFTQVLTTPYLRLKLFFFVNFTQLNAKVAEVWLGEYNLYYSCHIIYPFLDHCIPVRMLRLMPSSIRG